MYALFGQTNWQCHDDLSNNIPFFLFLLNMLSKEMKKKSFLDKQLHRLK